MEKDRNCVSSNCRHNSYGMCSSQTDCNKKNSNSCSSPRRKEKITLEAWAGRCGMIFPCGFVKVAKGNDITFLIKADAGYCIQDVMVDGERITDDRVVIENQEKYCLLCQRVTCPHRIDAYFMRK